MEKQFINYANVAIKVLIITGDNLMATQNIIQKLKMKGSVIEASELDEIDNIKDIAAICCALPEDKLTILNLLKNKGYVVGMTGDGMNDALALKAADVGIVTYNAVDLAKQSAGIISCKKKESVDRQFHSYQFKCNCSDCDSK